MGMVGQESVERQRSTVGSAPRLSSTESPCISIQEKTREPRMCVCIYIYLYINNYISQNLPYRSLPPQNRDPVSHEDNVRHVGVRSRRPGGGHPAAFVGGGGEGVGEANGGRDAAKALRGVRAVATEAFRSDEPSLGTGGVSHVGHDFRGPGTGVELRGRRVGVRSGRGEDLRDGTGVVAVERGNGDIHGVRMGIDLR